MDHEFFEGLSQEEAHAYLKRYLEVASASTAAMLRKAQADDLDAEFSIDSIAPVLGWVSRRVEIVRLDAPADIPDRIVTAMERDHGGFRDFRDESKPLVLSAGYYFGESFV